ncbi:MAG: hypothetical protein ACJ79R_23035 [Anaeromyxobacteraceae bacterium]
MGDGYAIAPAQAALLDVQNAISMARSSTLHSDDVAPVRDDCRLEVGRLVFVESGACGNSGVAIVLLPVDGTAPAAHGCDAGEIALP